MNVLLMTLSLLLAASEVLSLIVAGWAWLREDKVDETRLLYRS